MYADIKKEDAFQLAFCARYSVIRLARLSHNNLAQSKENPSATEWISCTHGRKKWVVSSFPYILQAIIAIYMNCGANDEIE